MAYNPQMQNRDVPPSGEIPSNPLFKQADAATIRGTQKMIAQRLLSQTNSEWGYCEVHKVICYCDDNGKYRDWANSIHDSTGGNISYPYKPFEKCIIVRIPQDAVLAADDSVGKVAEQIVRLKQTLEEAGMVQGGGDADLLTEDYRRPPPERQPKGHPYVTTRTDERTGHPIHEFHENIVGDPLGDPDDERLPYNVRAAARKRRREQQSGITETRHILIQEED